MKPDEYCCISLSAHTYDLLGKMTAKHPTLTRSQILALIVESFVPTFELYSALEIKEPNK